MKNVLLAQAVYIAKKRHSHELVIIIILQELLKHMHSKFLADFCV